MNQGQKEFLKRDWENNKHLVVLCIIVGILYFWLI